MTLRRFFRNELGKIDDELKEKLCALKGGARRRIFWREDGPGWGLSARGNKLGFRRRGRGRAPGGYPELGLERFLGARRGRHYRGAGACAPRPRVSTVVSRPRPPRRKNCFKQRACAPTMPPRPRAMRLPNPPRRASTSSQKRSSRPPCAAAH